MLAIQADEQGRPVLVESVLDEDVYFREVDAERWLEIIHDDLGLSDAQFAIVPVASGENAKLREVVRIGKELAGHVTRPIALSSPFDRDVLRYHANLFHDAEREARYSQEVSVYTPTIIDHQTGQQLHAASWIDVEVKLPDDGIIVIVYVPDESEPVWLAYMDEDAEWRYVSGGRCHPKYWMDLPEPPTAS